MGFARAEIAQRHDWLRSAAGNRYEQIEQSVLVQQTHVGPGSDAVRTDIAGRLNDDLSMVDETPFVLVGSASQMVEKLAA